MVLRNYSIRNLDKSLMLEARIYAVQQGLSLGEVVNASLDEFFSEVEDEDEDEDEEDKFER